MARMGRTRLSDRALMRRFAASAKFPRWITVPCTLIVGLILWLGVLADPSGHLRTPGAGSILYVVAVIGVAAFLAYTDRKGDSSGKNRKHGLGSKRRRDATAK